MLRKSRRKIRVNPPPCRKSKPISKSPYLRGFLDSKGVAKLFGVAERTISEWVRLGRFPKGTPAPGGDLWKVEKIIDFLNKGQPSAREIERTVKIASGEI